MIIVTQNNIATNEPIIDECIEHIKLSDSLEDTIKNMNDHWHLKSILSLLLQQ